jgi:hypothetical protein
MMMPSSAMIACWLLQDTAAGVSPYRHLWDSGVCSAWLQLMPLHAMTSSMVEQLT